MGCGFIVAPELVQSFSAAARQQAYNSPLQMQRTLFDFITQGYIGRHANRLRKAHGERRKAALAALRRGAFTGDLSFQAAGSYLVASFRNVSEPGLLERALEENRVGARVLARPGRRERLLLVGYAGAPREELFAAIGVLDSAAYAILPPSDLTTGAHFFMSAWMNASNCMRRGCGRHHALGRHPGRHGGVFHRFLDGLVDLGQHRGQVVVLRSCCVAS